MNRPSRAWMVVVALGLYLTLRGYHSRDGDQAYRLPLLLHWQDPSAYANDPFVRAFDQFNPHRGYLALMDLASRPLGLSFGLAILFAATFVLTCLSIDRLARLVWPEGNGRVGLVAVLLVLTAKAGNIGTNHLFEAMLLDRLVALSLGWTALAEMLEDSRRGRLLSAGLLGAATLIHPSLGLQLTMLAGSGWILWAVLSRWTGLNGRSAMAGLVALGAATVPGVVMMAGAGSRLMEGMPPEDFLTISATIQSPQHMLPHLWRMPQWLAAACYPTLAAVALFEARCERSTARTRIALLLALNLAGLAAAWVAVEAIGSVRATVFQPFRMATVARGLCLVLAASHVLGLWERGSVWGRCRAALLVAGLTGDWAFVVATAVEAASFLGGAMPARLEKARSEILAGGLVLAWGLVFLSRHDTESGHVRLIAAAGLALAVTTLGRGAEFAWNRRRMVFAGAIAWIVPAAAMVVPAVSSGTMARSIAAHCRFGEWATDDVERLALWCRDHTEESARFVGPPGPKTFRLWSRRELAFNRAASPYHAAGLADWSSRFRDHVGFRGTTAEFARSYLANRQSLERRYDEMDAEDRAGLATRSGAQYVVTTTKTDPPLASPLELMHVEGRYSVFRVRPGAVRVTSIAPPRKR